MRGQGERTNRGTRELNGELGSKSPGAGALTGCGIQGRPVSLVQDGAPVLGTWQGIYLFEHRDRPHRREVALHLIGE